MSYSIWSSYLLSSRRKNLYLIKLVIFDRDNTLIRDEGHVHTFDETLWLPGAKDLIVKLTNQKILIAVATNQSGVAKGMYSVQSVQKFHADMLSSLGSKGSIKLFAYCPHHPQGVIPEYSFECDCRKPKPGMLNYILNELNMDNHEVLFFGDSDKDVEAGKHARISTEKVLPGSILLHAIKKLKEHNVDC
jgi:D-glycero-D-manno-heptose 1,7-bisphosphate phosphatase